MAQRLCSYRNMRFANYYWWLWWYDDDDIVLLCLFSFTLRLLLLL